ncbi:MAG TPA: hypothetical protein VLL97_00985 [Acidobacteriota bacterium]|nr:hypothetical protein [Acidobacteriota bacterium]
MKHHIRLLKWANFNALKPYIPAFSALRREPKDSDAAQATAWVYGFKRHFKDADDFRVILEASAAHFGCDGIVPIPPSDPAAQPNSLQRLFGAPIRRTRAVETRKYNHHRFLPNHYQETYEVTPPPGRRFLLVDDILRTGTTMNHFRVTLAGMGRETVPLALGIYYRLPHEAGDSISIFIQKSETDLALDEMILEI